MSPPFNWTDYDPHLPPDWRWRRVRALAGKQPEPGRCGPRDDHYVRGMRAFVVRRNQFPDDEHRYAIYSQHPGAAFAYDIRDNGVLNPGVEFAIQARLLAGQTAGEIAALANTAEEVVEWYAAVYFDVTGRLHRQDWVNQQVLMPAIVRQYGEGATYGVRYDIARPLYDSTLKLFAYRGGPAAVELLLSGGFSHHDTPKNPDDVPEWLNRVWRNTLLSRSARSTMFGQLSVHNIAPLFAAHAQLVTAAEQAKGKGGAAPEYAQIVGSILANIPFTSGALGDKVAEARGVAYLNRGHVEPRAAELVEAGLGGRPRMPALPPRTAPAARPPSPVDGPRRRNGE